MIKKNIEDFRLNEFFGTYLIILSLPNKPKFEMAYNSYSINGFYSTSDDIKDLENSNKYVNNGRNVLSCISFWFLALESFTNCICKVVALKKSDNINDLVKLDITSRLTYILNSLNYDELSIKKSGIYGRINEFKMFRNELFHDRNFGNHLQFKKTKFSPNPQLSNQVDVLQSLIIYLEVLMLLRFVIPGIDLMPNISIGNSKIFRYDKLDRLYNDFLLDHFKKTLQKHNLETELETSISHFTSLSSSLFFSKGEVVVIERVKQEDKFNYPLNQSYTDISKSIYENIISNYNLPDGHNSGLNFIIEWNDFKNF